MEDNLPPARGALQRRPPPGAPRPRIRERPRSSEGMTLARPLHWRWRVASENVQGTRGVVLIVEGDPGMRAATADLLSRRYEVLAAADADSAHALAASRKPDAALMGVSLPGVDGPSALLRWRADERTAGIPVLMLSGARADEDLQVTCFSRGATDFVQRPVSPRLLLARLDRAVRESRERRRLESAAQTDALTGLANYRALDARLRQELERARRYRYPLAVAMLDLDHLKLLNDRFGHTAGNQVLAGFARLLTRSLRGTDFAARYGGDEFAVLLAYQTWREAAVFCERLRSSLTSLPLAGDASMELGTTVSVGVAAHAPAAPKASAEALLSAADSALYEAKRRGRNQVVIYERDLPGPTEGAARGH